MIRVSETAQRAQFGLQSRRWFASGLAALAIAATSPWVAHIAIAQPAPSPTTVPAAAPTTRQSTLPTTAPAMPRKLALGPQRDETLNTLFDALLKHYKTMLEPNEDPIVRCLGLVSTAKIPRADATDAILVVLADAAKKTPMPDLRPNLVANAKQRPEVKNLLVAELAWECMLSRASLLTSEQFESWMRQTDVLLEKRAIRGELRVGLLQLLEAWGPDLKSKQYFAWIFEHTNYDEQIDFTTMVSLGRCLDAWRAADVTEAVLRQLASRDAWLRADYVLHGLNPSFMLTTRATLHELGTAKARQQRLKEAAQWWDENKTSFTVAPTAAAKGKSAEKEPAIKSAASTSWRSARPHFVPSPQLWDEVDPFDNYWTQDLELGKPSWRPFDLSFILDVTGSMGNAIRWLKSDVARMADTLQLVASKPRLGVTFFRDRNEQFVARTVPINADLQRLLRELDNITAAGGGDQPEAVRDGLQDCLNKNNWSTDPKTSRVLILIGDAPPHPETQKECEELVKMAAAKNFRFYPVKVLTGFEASDLTTFHQLADVGRGTTFDIDVRLDSVLDSKRQWQWGLISAAPRWNIPGENPDPSPLSPAGQPEIGPTMMSRILADQIDHPFEDRVEPIVKVTWEILKGFSQQEKRLDEAPMRFGNANAGPPPKNPQAK